MTTPRPTPALARILALDALTCALMGAGLTLGAGPVADLTSLPRGLLLGAGLALLPVAGFIALVARGRIPLVAGTRAVIAGNLGWALASLLPIVSGWGTPNALGQGVVLAQAVAVLALTALEHSALRRATAA